MVNGLEHLVAEGVITEVLARLQSGKEAEVYVVRFGGRVVAAKVYKDREHRSFKNNASYMEGRSMRSSRSQRAIDRGTRFGKAAAEDAWKSAEADALYKLHAAEVRVPTPVLFLDGVLLMELVLDANGEPARRLIDTDLSVEQANAAYHDMLNQIVRILSCDLIHGDLSPYNVLWAAAGPTVIDFPQIISASHNSGSQRFFLRDAENILGHFARIDRTLQARRGDASEIWRAYVSRELTPEFRPSGRGRPPAVPTAPIQRHAPPQRQPVPMLPTPQRNARPPHTPTAGPLTRAHVQPQPAAPASRVPAREAPVREAPARVAPPAVQAGRSANFQARGRMRGPREVEVIVRRSPSSVLPSSEPPSAIAIASRPSANAANAASRSDSGEREPARAAGAVVSGGALGGGDPPRRRRRRRR
jgi:RIO kinase 1